MRKPILGIVLFLLLAVWLTGPAFSLSDPWDSYPDTGDTITLFLAVLGSCIGALFSLVLLLYPLLRTILAGLVLPFPRQFSDCNAAPSPNGFFPHRSVLLRI